MALAIVKKEQNAKPGKKKTQHYDPIFFRKFDIAVGVELLYKGRLYPDTRWTIVDIRSEKRAGGPLRSVKSVEKVTDFLILRNRAGKSRAISFLYASYSAIWQLPRPMLKRVK